MSLLDDWGESLGGIWDSAVEGGEQWVDAWMDNEAENVASSAPEENRTPQHEEPAKQPTGQPIYPGGLSSNTTLMLLGGGMFVLMGFTFLMLRGK
ncbi:hypothetical protein [Photobacterium atrarenae]|uniref:Gram-positive cocci surface proteins LPxTG domain-containing protein n=1 Tax=Photobacterium atrarenae TaxID=865757 RepID=A0ABY5GE23_9GAMM|nr:hypothetical protein [Photobacterium atrarenae]UTV27503.1 hypothetical protein NNL38_14500 [Photobacterium atrarenae]